MTVGLTGLGTYLPEGTMTAADIAARSGVPEDVVCFLAAGTGYTWAATVLEWRG